MHPVSPPAEGRQQCGERRGAAGKSLVVPSSKDLAWLFLVHDLRPVVRTTEVAVPVRTALFEKGKLVGVGTRDHLLFAVQLHNLVVAAQLRLHQTGHRSLEKQAQPRAGRPTVKAPRAKVRG